MAMRICSRPLSTPLFMPLFAIYGVVIAAGGEDSGQAVRVAVGTESNGPHLGI